MRRPLQFLSPALVLTCLSAGPLFAQNHEPTDGPSFVQTFGKPVFVYDTYAFASDQPGKTRLDVYCAFVNDILQFVKNGDHLYKARYEMVVEILDRDGNRQDGEISRKEIVANNFQETNARNIVNQNAFSFQLPPGPYKLHLEIVDLDTRRHLVRTRDIGLKDFRTSQLAFSDLMFVDDIKLDSNRVSYVRPNMRKSLDEPDSHFGVYFELYNLGADSVRLTYSVYDPDNQPVVNKELNFASGTKDIRQFIALKDDFEHPGQYVFVVEARTKEDKATERRTFFVQYTNQPPAGSKPAGGSESPHATPSHKNASVYQNALKYIADKKDFAKMMELAPDKRAQWLRSFWEKRNPTPDTGTNELLEEFHRRVDFAMQNFSVASEDKPGWNTDRGKIYIIYGPPSDVQRRSIDIDSNPYEVWYYKSIDKRFVFLDKSGLGNYRLVHKD